MDKNNDDAVKKFLDFAEEDKTFDDDTENPFSDGDEPEVVEEPEESKEKPLPFNKDPKVQKYLEKEMNKLREEFASQQTVREEPKNQDTTDVVSAFEAIIGNDTPEKVAALKSLERALGNVDQRASEKAIAKLDEIRLQESLADKEAEDELSEAFDSIEDTYGVDISSNTQSAKKLRNDFVTYVERIAPKDRNGDIIAYPDMSSAWETFSEIKKATQIPSRAKELASRGTARSAEAVITEPQKRVSFDMADDFIASL